jgi:hypothetical protein
MRRITGWIVDHSWLTLAVTVALTAFFLVFVPRLHLQTDFGKYLPESDRTVRLMRNAEKLFGSQEFFMVLVEAPDSIFTVSTIAEIHAMEVEFAAVRGIDEVLGPTTATVISAEGDRLTIEAAAEPLPTTQAEVDVYRQKVMGDRNLRGYIFANNGRAAGIVLKPSPYLDDTGTLVAEVNRIAKAHETATFFTVYVGGIAPLRSAIGDSMMRDMLLLTPLVLLVMEILVFLAFRTGRGVALPFLLMTFTTIWTIGLMALTRVPLTAFSFFMPVMLITASKAYAIFTVNRYYEEAAHGGQLSRREIIVNTMHDMAKPLAMDALAEVAGFLSLLAATLWPQQTFGLFIAAGIVCTLLLNFVLLPAILALLPLPRKHRDYEHGWLPNVLVCFGRLIARQRVAVLVLSALILVAFVVAIPRLRVDTSPSGYLGDDHPAMNAMHALDRNFGGSSQVSIQIDTGKTNGLKDPAVLKEIVGLQEFIQAQPEYGGSITSLANLVREMNQKMHGDDPSFYAIPDDPKLTAQLLTLFTFSGGGLWNMATPDFSQGEVVARTSVHGTAQIADLARRVKEYVADHFPSTLHAELVGTEQAWASLAQETVPNTEMTLLIALMAALLIVTLLLRSLVAGLVAVTPMVLTIAINLGTMSYLHLPLDLASLMIGSITVGVGIDYTINFMIRWRTEVSRGRSLEEAHEVTMRTMGRGILFNALTLTAGFAMFYFSAFEGLRNFGLLINLTMIWSFLGSFIVVPALLLALKPRFLTGGRGGKELVSEVSSSSWEVQS